MEPSLSGGIYRLPAIPYLRLTHTLRALAPARLPAFKGSMLRGAFGHALRRSVCLMGPQQPCKTCRLRRACAYTRIFETFIEQTPPPFLRGLDTAPRPYVFEPADERRDFAPGDPLAFDLLLVGQAADLQAYALLAVERMAAAGLGRDRVPFALVRVEAQAPDGSRPVLFENDPKVKAPSLPVREGGRGRERGGWGSEGPAAARPTEVLTSLPPRDGLAGSRATLRLLTPLRLKARGQLVETLDFRTLAFAMLRRTLELAHFHVPGAEIDWTFRPLLDRAADVRLTAAGLAWRDWDRYSNRQRAPMTLGGLTGEAGIEGDLAPFAPLLRAAEVLHVGKGATFGLGRIAIATA